jgi:hypothetical protein
MVNSNLLELIAQYELEGVVSLAELESVLAALALLKRESGWGRIELVVKGSELNDVNVTIWNKVKGDIEHTEKKKTV